MAIAVIHKPPGLFTVDKVNYAGETKDKYEINGPVSRHNSARVQENEHEAINIVRMLYDAYAAGRVSMQKDIRQLLAVRGTD